MIYLLDVLKDKNLETNLAQNSPVSNNGSVVGSTFIISLPPILSKTMIVWISFLSIGHFNL